MCLVTHFLFQKRVDVLLTSSVLLVEPQHSELDLGAETRAFMLRGLAAVRRKVRFKGVVFFQVYASRALVLVISCIYTPACVARVIFLLFWEGQGCFVSYALIGGDYMYRTQLKHCTQRSIQNSTAYSTLSRAATTATCVLEV